MRTLILVAVLHFAVPVAAAEDESVFGTHWVQFQPLQVQGEMQGCQVTFLTVAADRAYRDGAQVAVNGSIALRLINKTPALTLKVGLKEIQSNAAFERPQFAYLQTATGSTSKAEQQIIDGDPGYKLFVYRATDAAVVQVLKELLSSRKATIGYNRKVDGIDVLVPLDLTVVDSEYTEDLKVKRVRSQEVAASFVSCTANTMKLALDLQKQ